jgi:hypothetical protein
MALPLPAAALPVLRSLLASSSWVNILVPGRPLTSVQIGYPVDGEDLLHTILQLKRSTHPITTLDIWVHMEPPNSVLVEMALRAIVESVPHLQTLTIFINVQVGISCVGY